MKKILTLLAMVLVPALALGQTVNYTPTRYVLAISGDGGGTYAPYTGASGIGPVSFTPQYFVPMCSATGAPPFSQCTLSGGGSSGFPITLGTTAIAASSTTTTIAGLTLTGATFIAPALGTPASGILTHATGLPLTTGVTGVLPAANTAAALSATTSVNGTSIPASVTLTQTIASGTATLGTTAIASASCATVVTVAGSGIASTDAIAWTPNGSIKTVTGYTPSTSGGLSISAYPTSGNVNFDVCNWTAGSITPGAVVLNWRVTR